jgi:hypothetical protein
MRKRDKKTTNPHRSGNRKNSPETDDTAVRFLLSSHERIVVEKSNQKRQLTARHLTARHRD